MRGVTQRIDGMGVIEELHEELDVDISLADYREAVHERVEKMGGLADEETAAMLVAHELDDSGDGIDGIADIDAGMNEVQFVAKVVSIDDLRTFDREEDDDQDADQEATGHVLNANVADETGEVRIAFWDAHARDAAESLTVGDTLRIKGRPADGYSGIEVNITTVEPAPDVDVDVRIDDRYQIEELTLGRSNVNVAGRVLDTDTVRTFDRDDGSTGQVANLSLGDPTGRVRVTLWDSIAETVETLTPGQSIEIIDGYTRERDGDLELHVGDRGDIEPLDEAIDYEPTTTSIDAVSMGDRVDLMGVVRSADPKRTFDRDDGTQGQVRNVRIQDDTGSIRIALWGDHADRDIGPGDTIAVTDVEIEDGWQDDLEASANWRSTVIPLGDDQAPANATTEANTAEEQATTPGESSDSGVALSSFQDSTTTHASTEATTTADGDETELTGVVVQPGDPVIIDTGTRTVTVETTADVGLGDEVTVSGQTIAEDHIKATDLTPTAGNR